MALSTLCLHLLSPLFHHSDGWEVVSLYGFVAQTGLELVILIPELPSLIPTLTCTSLMTDGAKSFHVFMDHFLPSLKKLFSLAF